MGIYSICSAPPGGVLFVSSRGGFFVLDGTAGCLSTFSATPGGVLFVGSREGFARDGTTGCLSTCSATPDGALFVGSRGGYSARRDNGCLSTSSGLRAERSSSAAVEAIVRDGTTGVFRPLANSGRSALRRQP